MKTTKPREIPDLVGFTEKELKDVSINLEDAIYTLLIKATETEEQDGLSECLALAGDLVSALDSCAITRTKVH